MKAKHKRLFFVGFGLALLGGAVALALVALQDTVTFFFTPSQAAERSIQPGQRVRLGGLVESGSVERPADAPVKFTVTDGKANVAVSFTGLLPDLFREGQGVVAQGTFGADRVFLADEVLAKHDEKYMPPEVAGALHKTKTAAAE